MARTALTVQQIARSGLAPSYTAANAAGHSVQNNGRVFLHVKNAGGSICNVTIETPGTVDGLAVADRTVAVAATTGDAMIGPFPENVYDQADGTINVDFDQVTSVTVAALRL